MLSHPVQSAAGRGAVHWSPAQIHDTVAAIARQPQYAASSQESLLGRLLTMVGRWMRDLLLQMKAWPDTRYLLIAAAILLVLLLAARVIIGQRVQARRAAGAGLRAHGADARNYWALGAELDAAGKHVEACHAIYAAVVDALARAGLLRFHISKTSGDYARELRQRAFPRAAEFAAFARQFERQVYGWSAPTHDDYARLSVDAARVVPAPPTGRAAA